ncbi:hypothetical protein N7492_004150 [Penicillium capsulatum]|uniref:Uncharacterized protein n=1 Tax=Penicillium capsulatum TaxID=69766 RepID=A0A9W9LX83_9EURO|nr:hypothetical protein N7492_004150 [Penicillium capsulatum]KAJ6121280.1 hypothetical protein N7512_003745 [Penicillium capsulatum]
MKWTTSFALLASAALSAAASIPGSGGTTRLEARGFKGSFEWRKGGDGKEFLLATCERLDHDGSHKWDGRLVKKKGGDDRRVCWVAPAKFPKVRIARNIKDYPDLPDWDTELFSCLPWSSPVPHGDDRERHGGCWKNNDPGEVPNHG